jgi:hypothetical protein
MVPRVGDDEPAELVRRASVGAITIETLRISPIEDSDLVRVLASDPEREALTLECRPPRNATPSGGILEYLPPNLSTSLAANALCRFATSIKIRGGGDVTERLAAAARRINVANEAAGPPRYWEVWNNVVSRPAGACQLFGQSRLMLPRKIQGVLAARGLAGVVSDTDQDALAGLVHELLSNVDEHGRKVGPLSVPRPGFASISIALVAGAVLHDHPQCRSYIRELDLWLRPRQQQVAATDFLLLDVVDCGPGIPSTVASHLDRRVGDWRDEVSLIGKALEHRFSTAGDSPREGRGLGFTNVFTALSSFGGAVRVQSGRVDATVPAFDEPDTSGEADPAERFERAEHTRTAGRAGTRIQVFLPLTGISGTTQVATLPLS